MKLKSLNNWGKLADLEPLLFFAQRADELLFDYTLDTYKASALNAPFLCLEALALIQDIENNNIEAANLEHVLAELEWSIHLDSIAKKLIHNDLSFYFPGEAVKNDLQKQKILLELIHKSISPDLYLYAVQEKLLQAIEQNKKGEISSLARTWITTLINIGVSKAYLYQLINSFFFSERKILASEDIKVFFLEAFPYTHNFEVYFITTKDITLYKKSLDKFDINICEVIPDDLKELASANNFNINSDEVFIEVAKINSFDIHSGRREAEAQLELVRNLILLYAHKKPISWSSTALVRQCCIDRPQVTFSPKSSVQKIADLRPQMASERLFYLIENLKLMKTDNEKFDRIISIHGLCAIQEAPETQLLNLWICIESLMPTEPNRNKISNIIEMAIPILMLIYVRRIIKNLLQDLLGWNRKLVRKTFNKFESNSDEKLVHSVLHFLAPENDVMRQEFYKKMDAFPLLRYRIFSISQLFSDPKKLNAMLEEHRKKLTWQLRRIYRTRNLIVHSGRSPNYTSTLIENAHDYLDSMLNEIAEASCSSMRISSFKQAFELFRIQHIGYERQLRKCNDFNLSNISSVYYSKQPRKTMSDIFDKHVEILTPKIY
jgi:hypothetical protein